MFLPVSHILSLPCKRQDDLHLGYVQGRGWKYWFSKFNRLFCYSPGESGCVMGFINPAPTRQGLRSHSGHGKPRPLAFARHVSSCGSIRRGSSSAVEEIPETDQRGAQEGPILQNCSSSKWIPPRWASGPYCLRRWMSKNIQYCR